MKPVIVAITSLLLLYSTIISAQTNSISFTFSGTIDGNYAQLDSIEIQNPDRNCDTTLYWPDTVFFKGNVGIDDLKHFSGGLRVFQNSPNPVDYQTLVRVFVPGTGPVMVLVSDIEGRVINSLEQVLEKGFHEFSFIPGSAGICVFACRFQSETKSIKIVSTAKPSSTQSSLTYRGSGEDFGNYKSSGSSGPFQFALNDNLVLTGYQGNHSNCYTDTPDTSKTYIFRYTSFTCGFPVLVNHIAGAVAPVTKTVTYNTVSNIPGEPAKCWITSNLGADRQATAVDDVSELSAGWYWQFNRKQGFKHNGSFRTPDSEWITSIVENIYWQTENDPCSLELGSGWRIPTKTEWLNADAAGDWTDWNGPWNSLLKIHAAGTLSSNNGALLSRGAYGFYWCGTPSMEDYGWYLFLYSGRSYVDINFKAFGFPLRCLRN
jgi:hypothetical protein